MAAAKRIKSLRGALNRFQGKDAILERQKRLKKHAEKRKRAKVNEEAENEEDDLDAEKEFDAAVISESKSVHEIEEEVWSSEAEDSDNNPIDASRLDDSDSDSDSDEVEVEVEETPNEEIKDSDVRLVDDEEEDIPFSDISDGESANEDVIPYQRLTINNTSALERALSSFALPVKSMPFSEHHSLTTAIPVLITDVDDDLEREVAFNAQALSAVKEARALLKTEGAPFSRPSDYFAEMVKSDEHMGKIKAKLVDDAANKKAAQEARRQRDLKKFGKQVQNEKLKERAKAKKDMLEKVNLLKRKRHGADLDNANEEDMFDVALEDAATAERRERNTKRSKGGLQTKRQKKDQKFGFGGKKRFVKSGDAMSSGDMSSYSLKKMKGKTGTAARLGKSRRAKGR